MDRRSFLKGAAAAAASVPFEALVSRADAVSRAGGGLRFEGYGPLVDAIDETTGLPLLQLPEGFRCVSFGWTGDVLADGSVTPGRHDGMAAFTTGPDRIRLVRNHETDRGKPFCRTAYNEQGSGGTTTLEFDTANGKFVSGFGSLSGTIRNCAGGPMPWGSWLTCEETTTFAGLPHGYVFEVPSNGLGIPTPIRDMGRFSHEAVAFDPATGYLYETEDPGASLGTMMGRRAKAGFYRFVPNQQGQLAAGGRLFMLRVKNRSKIDLGESYKNGARFDVEWAPISRPDNPDRGMPSDFVWAQGRELGAATFKRLEGCWYGVDRRIYIVSTDGGIGDGQIWVYHPAAETISLLFQSPGKHVLDHPDHMTVSPRGGIVLCEDGSGEEYLHGLTVDGRIFKFGKNNVRLRGERNGHIGDFRHAEWAGPCYSPDGKWLFVNILSPGITFAITGPWGKGLL